MDERILETYGFFVIFVLFTNLPEIIVEANNHPYRTILRAAVPQQPSTGINMESLVCFLKESGRDWEAGKRQSTPNSHTIISHTGHEVQQQESYEQD